MEINEQTPLLVTVRVKPLQQGYQHKIAHRFFTIALRSTIIAVILYLLFRIVSLLCSLVDAQVPLTNTLVCYSSLNTSRAYASAEALNNNIDNFCQDVANNVPLITFDWTRSKTYYPNTPDEYTMTISFSNQMFNIDQHHLCTDAMSSIINGCDVPANGSNPMNWKQGGKLVQGKYSYQIDILHQNRPWPPPIKPRQRCMGWYKFILQHYDIYGAGWANYDWGQKSLMPAINPCCGLGSLTGWHFEYFDQPDENGYEWHSWFNTAIGTRRRCFDNNRVQCAAGGPCDSYCGGNG
ncbi:hypothetical protein BGZ60DRAFT_393555 [Tricladium varicosporioides]|nr:hypothetical protein BGZ60DRAFT_393555 [Hymenoscyphus varicosporioides]